MITITINGRNRNIPQAWAEVAPADLIYIFNIFFKELSQSQFLSSVALRFMRLGKIMEYRLDKAFRTHPHLDSTQTCFEGITRVSELLTFLVTTPPNITENPFPVMKNLHATDSILRDFTLWEFQLAENYFRDFIQEKSEQSLNNLLGIIYRPRKSFFRLRKIAGNTEPDCRETFDDNRTAIYAKRLSRLPIGQRYASLLWFKSQLAGIYNDYKFLFPEKSTGKTDGHGWLDVIFMLSQAGKEDNVASTKLSIVLERLAYNHREAKKLETSNT